MRRYVQTPIRVMHAPSALSMPTGKTFAPGDEVEVDEDWLDEYGAASVWARLCDDSGYVWKAALAPMDKATA
jgi:hypothetical protein